MKSLQPDQAIQQIFSPLFRIHVHHLIFVGYTDIRETINANSDETTITGFIVDAINNQMDSSNPPRWYKHYSVYDDPPIPSEKRTGRSRLRVDIIIRAHNIKGRPQYCFEAKRLRKNGYPASKYVGDDGMGCFISGRYASRYQEAAMIGYVQSDTVADWREKILAEISKQADSLLLKSAPQNVTIIQDLPNEWMSQHNRVDLQTPISLYHILLDCHSFHIQAVD